MEKNTKPIEEYENNRGTGIEEEQPSADLDLSRPYDPKKIRVDAKPFSIAQAMEMIQDNDLDIAPEFQRRRVWGEMQKSLLIESILLRIPLPVFYFAADEEGRMQVVDGVQRLSTIRDFMDNKFPLSSLEYLQEELKGKYYKEMKDTLWSRRLLTTSLTAYVIDPQTPDGVKFDIFKRLNTGGTPLNTQEIRHCISKPRTRHFLAELSNMDAFHEATQHILRGHVRMMDMELALRYCAFSLLDHLEEEYPKLNGMDDLLTRTVRKLDTPSLVSDQKLKTLKDRFEQSMRNAYQLFDKYAFRKWYSKDGCMNPINRALFDVWSVLLARFETEELLPYKKKIVEASRMAMTDNDEFINAITSSTSNSKQVKARFRIVQEILDESLST